MQSLALPFYPVPRDFKGPALDDPKLSQLKHETKICTVFMVGVPLIVYNFVKYYFLESLRPNEDMWAGIAAVISVNIVILVIIVWKYSEDVRLVLNNEGDKPYD